MLQVVPFFASAVDSVCSGDRHVQQSRHLQTTQVLFPSSWAATFKTTLLLSVGTDRGIYIFGAKQTNTRITVIDVSAVLVTRLKRCSDEETNCAGQDVGFASDFFLR